MHVRYPEKIGCFSVENTGWFFTSWPKYRANRGFDGFYFFLGFFRFWCVYTAGYRRVSGRGRDVPKVHHTCEKHTFGGQKKFGAGAEPLTLRGLVRTSQSPAARPVESAAVLKGSNAARETCNRPQQPSWKRGLSPKRQGSFVCFSAEGAAKDTHNCSLFSSN